MEARIKQDYRWKIGNACGGIEFVKSEWRPVPLGKEGEAQACEILEIRAIEKIEKGGSVETPPEEKPKSSRPRQPKKKVTDE